MVMAGDIVLRDFSLYNCIPSARGDVPPPPKPPASFGKPSPDESRRDRIAIAAMQGLLSGEGHFSRCADVPAWYKALARRAYDIADAMIAERGRR